MNELIKIQQQILKETNSIANVSIKDECVLLTGEFDNWADIVTAGLIAARGKKFLGVLNDIKLKGFKEPPMKVPAINDKKFNNLKVDILVIGGGISGTAILRELSKYNISCALVDKECDLAMQATSRNDGEVHVGIDLKGKSKKLDYVVKGNDMYEDLCRDLDVTFKRRGQYVLFDKRYMYFAKFILKSRAKKANIVGMEFIKGKNVFKRVPNANRDTKYAVYFPSAGSVCPYNMAIALAENAVQNGAMVMLNTAVIDMEVVDNKIVKVVTNRGNIYPAVVVNAAGVFADKIAEMANDRFYTIHPRKGTNSILDKNSVSKLTDSIVAKYGSSKGHTKGGGFLATADDNILIGPNAVETPYREDVTTSVNDIDEVFNKQKKAMPNLSKGDIITYFSGVRAPTYEEDFVISKGKKTFNLVHAAGIQSPGLTAAPAFAIDVANDAIELFSNCGAVEKKTNFINERKGVKKLREMPLAERNELIKQNPDYGTIICRCEEISKGEIVDAIHSIIPVDTMDAIKRRCRPGMGRCQGGFCGPLVLKILSDETGKKAEDILKKGLKGVVVYGDTKGGAK